jgi:hypothetical protein
MDVTPQRGRLGRLALACRSARRLNKVATENQTRRHELEPFRYFSLRPGSSAAMQRKFANFVASCAMADANPAMRKVPPKYCQPVRGIPSRSERS